jgi:outer membrane protein OmpA-like peptidoglycan-associated protein
LICSDAFGQVLNGNNGDHRKIKAEFVKENIKIKPRTPFFNVLKIYNQSDQSSSFILQFETPVGWSLITQREKRISIQPHDTITVPVRASAKEKVKGEIGYSIIASLQSRSGDPITTAYCFIKVPRKSSLQFRPLTRVGYIDQQKDAGTFSFRLVNNGNIDEVVYLNFTTTASIEMEGEVNNTYSTDILVPSKTDTTLNYNVTVKEKDADRSLYRINLNGSTENTKFNSTFWFKSLVSNYKYEKPSTEMPLILELSMENLFSERDSYFSGLAKGNILFEDKKDFQFYFHKFPERGRRSDFFKSSKFNFTYNTPKYIITAGNRIQFDLRTGYGKGLAFNYKDIKNFDVRGKYVRHEFYPINNYGMNLRFNLFESGLDLNTNIEYSDDLRFDKQVMLGELVGRYSIKDEHRIRSEIGLSSKADDFSPIGESGMHYDIDYTGKIGDINIHMFNRYNSPNYHGSFYGKNNLSLNTNYYYKKGYRFRLFFRNSLHRPSTVYREGVDSENFRLQRKLSFRTTKSFGNSISLYGEPIYQYFKSNSFYNLKTSSPFILNGTNFKVGGRLSFGNYSRLSSSIKGGMSFVTQYQKESLERSQISKIQERENGFTAVFNLNYFARNWGVFFKYNYGPYNGNQYYTYLYTGSFNQLIRFMPYYRSFVYEDLIQLDSRLNYMFSVNRKTHRLNWSNEIRFHLNYGILLRFLANFTFQSTLGESQNIQQQEEQQYTYSNSYFELRIQKRFGWNQPRMKYYNMKVNLFKDLNGNLKRDANEPGVKDVMVNIDKLDHSKIDTLDVDYESAGNLTRNRLLSGISGQVSYKNIPQGVYRLKLKNVGKNTGKFSADQQEVLVHMNQNRTINIPYLEKNKIFGKVILNRSKLSNLGNIDVSNIKVIAEDSKGRKTSALTNKKGEFTIYAPSVDKYDVYVNNIFKEHFNLRKNHYTVQLNGYKQFEVNFIFDEKRRQINFTPSGQDDDVEVKSVKRTNLSGVVKDENTLEPVRAEIEIVDNTTGGTVATTHSDRKTGRFSTSFMTGPNYSMIVTAPGYWFYSEELELDQMLTIQDVEKEILLENIIIGKKIELDNLNFKAGSAEIPNDAYPELDRLIKQLKQNPNIRIKVEGHSDALETLDNPEISEKRAKAVTKYMMQNGFSNIEYVGYKDKRPVAPNDSETNRAKNRRVEFVIVDK